MTAATTIQPIPWIVSAVGAFLEGIAFMEVGALRRAAGKFPHVAAENLRVLCRSETYGLQESSSLAGFPRPARELIRRGEHMPLESRQPLTHPLVSQ